MYILLWIFLLSAWLIIIICSGEFMKGKFFHEKLHNIKEVSHTPWVAILNWCPDKSVLKGVFKFWNLVFLFKILCFFLGALSWIIPCLLNMISKMML